MRPLLEVGVDHCVADEENFLIANSASAQLVIGCFTGGKEEIGQGVGRHAIDFFRHTEVS